MVNFVSLVKRNNIADNIFNRFGAKGHCCAIETTKSAVLFLSPPTAAGGFKGGGGSCELFYAVKFEGFKKNPDGQERVND